MKKYYIRLYLIDATVSGKQWKMPGISGKIPVFPENLHHWVKLIRNAPFARNHL